MQALGTKWCEFWSESDPERWLAMYTPDATYLDHILQINRKGTANIREHFGHWRGALPDSKAVFEGAWPAEQLPGGRWRIIFKVRWTGTFSNDLEALKATGDKVNFPLRAEMIVRDDGLIEEAAEWYCLTFWTVKPVDDYHRAGVITWTEGK